MKIDIEDNTFDRRKHFSRVLTQQGRVLTAADSNERDDVLLHYLRTLAADLIGAHGGPVAKAGFEIALVTGTTTALTDLKIGRGRYYVDGILCENDEVDKEGKEVEVTYRTQPDYPLPEGASQIPKERPLLVYVDVWERSITAIEDPGIPEVALGGPDTATRAKLVWQVKIEDEIPAVFAPDDSTSTIRDKVEALWDQWVKEWQPANRGTLKAKGKEAPDEDSDPCITSPEARYRGVENQLYRVEIHKGGRASTATFKWSRDNGSVAFPIRNINGPTVTLEHLGRDSRLSLKVDDYVGIEDDGSVLRAEAEPLLQVKDIDFITMQVTLNKTPPSGVGRDSAKHPLLRRWDHGKENSKKGLLEQDSGTLPVKEDTWIELEDGVYICFERATFLYTTEAGDTLNSIEDLYDTRPNELLRLNPEITPNTTLNVGHKLTVPGGAGEAEDVYHTYRIGDYWLIPARTATGDVEWPGDVGEPEPRPPHGIEHHYAPLAIAISAGDNGVIDCRRRFEPNVSLDLRLDTGSAEWMVTQDPDSGTVEPRPANIIARHSAWSILPGTQWIGPSNQLNPPNGDYHYRLCFYLCSGFQNARLTFDILQDDVLKAVRLNTTNVPFPPTSTYQTSAKVDLFDQSAFMPGENCITLVVANTGGGPTGVDIAGSVTAERGLCACP